MQINDGSIDVESLPDEVAARIFNDMHDSVEGNINVIQNAFQSYSKLVADREECYLKNDGEKACIDYDAIGRDIIDISVGMFGLVDENTSGSITLSGADIFSALAYMLMCSRMGHESVQSVCECAKSINESIGIYETAPAHARQNPLVYMSQMAKFRSELSELS